MQLIPEMKFLKPEISAHIGSPAGILKSRSAIALGLIAIFLIIGQVTIFNLTLSHLENSRTINIAGRQRMLSQKIGKDAVIIRASVSEKERNDTLDELNESVKLFELSHDGLIYGNTQLGLPKENDPQILFLFNELEPSYNSLLTAAKRLSDAAEKGDRGSTETLTAAILESEKPFLKGMDDLVFHHDEATKEHTKFLGQVNLILLVLILFVLFLEGIFIFRPTITYVEKAFNKLKEVDDLKDEFVSLASHELRTPMTSISGFVDMMREGRYGPVTKELQEPLGYVAQSTSRLIRLVGDLLNVSRIEAGRMKFTLGRVDLGNIASKVVTELQPMAKKRKLELSLETKEDVIVQADAEKVEQILNNLIGNSLKFTDKGKITVTARKDNDLGILEVVDTGIGIPEDKRDKLFGKFEQVNTDPAGRPPGTGLGLYISRQMAQKMGGNVLLVESKPGLGSKFKVSLPIPGSTAAEKTNTQIEMERGIQPDQK